GKQGGAAGLADNLDLYWNQQLLDVLLEYPIHSDRSEFAIRMRVDRFGQNVSTALRFLPPEGTARPFEFHGDPGLVRLDPRWHHAAMAFVVSGFWHILRQRSHTLLVLPGNSVPAAAAPRHHRNSFHRRAFDFSDRLGLRLCPGCALVPAAHRNVDRGDDHLHGAGKHRLCGTWNVWWRHF